MDQASLSRPIQRDRVLTLLKSRAPDWVPLPAILALGIAQYNARIYELRRLGYRIESKHEGDHNWFRLVTNHGPTMVHEPRFSPASTETSPPVLESLFADIAPERRWRDDG
jgi:hypothetical protein